MNNRFLKKESIWIFLLPLTLFILIRAPLLHFPPFGDEDLLIRDAASLGHSNLCGYPILAMIFIRIGMAFLALNQLRWVVFIFSLGVFALTALIAKELLGFWTAFWACLFLAVNPLSISVSCQLLFDGAFVCLFFLATVYFYIRCSRENSNWRLILWIVACGLSFGLLQMTSYAAFALISGIALHSLLRQGLKKTILIFGGVFALGAAVFSIYPAFFPAHYHFSTLKLAVVRKGTNISMLGLAAPRWYYAASLGKAVVFSGPLALLGTLFSLVSSRCRRETEIPLLASLVYCALILIFLNPTRTSGYWAPVIPFFCIASAAAFTKDFIPISSNFISLFLLTTFYWAIFALLTWMGPFAIAPLHPLHFSGRTFVDFLTLRMFYGPSLCLYVRPAAAIFGFLGFALFLILLQKKPSFQRHLLALGLAYGVFYGLEYVHPLFSPNLNKVGGEILSFLEKKSLPEPIYLHGYGAFNCELHGVHVYPFMYDDAQGRHIARLASRSKGSVVIVDSPVIGPETDLMRFLRHNASLTRDFRDKGVILAQIWTIQRTAVKAAP